MTYTSYSTLCDHCDHPGFEDLLQGYEKLYGWTWIGDSELNSIISSIFHSKPVHILSAHSHTNRLSGMYTNRWYVGIAIELIDVDRTGSWQLHFQAVAECLPIFAAFGHGDYEFLFLFD